MIRPPFTRAEIALAIAAAVVGLAAGFAYAMSNLERAL